MGATITAAELAKITGNGIRWVQIKAQKEKWPHKLISGRGRPRKEFFIDKLPEEYRLLYYKKDQKNQKSRLLNQGGIKLPSLSSIQGDTPPICEKQIEVALAKADLLQLYMKHVTAAAWGRRDLARAEFMDAYNKGLAYPRLFKILGEVNWKTIEGWKRQVKSQDVLDLADKRGYCKRGQRVLLDEHKKILLRCALNPNRPKVSEVIRVARAVMKTKAIHNGYSDATYRRWLEDWKSKNYHIWVFSRQGAKAWNDKCAPYIERDYNLINVGDVLVADGHILNFEILNPWTGKPKRMTLILWYDMKSSFPLGWDIMPTENTQVIASALRRAILRLGKYPQVAYLDNGKAFGARFFNGVDFEQAGFSGLFERLGMKTIFAWPYHAQSKTVERFFKTFGELERWAPTYVGTSIEKKPPRLNRGERIHRKVYDKLMDGGCITMEQAHRAIATWFDMYVERPQRGHLDGRKPIDVFAEEKGPGVDAAELHYLMMSMEIRSVQRNGIRFLGKNYYHPELYGRNHSVVIRYDLQDSSSVLVFDKNGAFLCEAEQSDKIHPAAHALGSEDDQSKLKHQIELKKRLEKDASLYARDFLESEVIPEHQRQMETLGIQGAETLLPGEIKKLPAALTKDDESKILAEYEDLKALNADMPADVVDDEYVPEAVDETAHIWGTLQSMTEMDRYDKLVEFDVRGWLIPSHFRAFMAYYEKTPEYEKYQDYFDEHRSRAVMMYQLEASGDGQGV